MTFVQNDTSKQFIDQVNRLIQAGTAAGFKEVADKMGWDKTAISNVMNGRRDIPHARFAKFCEVYGLDNPAQLGYKEKYYAMLEQRLKELDQSESMLRELIINNKHLAKRIDQLEKSSVELHHSLVVSAAMQTAYQEWVIDHASGEGNSRKVMNSIRKKAVALLTAFETNGIGVDMGIVPGR